MTDPTPNRPPLSPAAQAVLEAWVAAQRTQTRTAGHNAPLAAALRAAADQVVPEPSDLDKEMFSIAALRHRWVIRDRFLAIANELDPSRAPD